METHTSHPEESGNQRADASRSAPAHPCAIPWHSLSCPVLIASPHNISCNSIYRLTTPVTTMVVPQDCTNIQEHQGVYRRPHGKTPITLHPSPIQFSGGGLTTPSSSAAQVAINKANATFTCRPTPHPQTTSPLQHQDNRNPQTKEDPAEDYLGESDTEVLLNTELLEEADQLARELENTVDAGQLPFLGPHPPLLPVPSPSPPRAPLTP